MYTIGQKIKELRKKNGMTQEELGEKIGVTKTVITRYENGIIQNIKMENIKKLADIFGVSPAELICYGEEAALQRLSTYFLLLNKDGIKKVEEYAEMLIRLGEYKK